MASHCVKILPLIGFGTVLTAVVDYNDIIRN